MSNFQNRKKLLEEIFFNLLSTFGKGGAKSKYLDYLNNKLCEISSALSLASWIL